MIPFRGSSRYFRPLFRAAVILLLLHQGVRFIFWRYNHQLFTDLSFREAFLVFCRGLQQDLVTIILLNSPVLLLCVAAGYAKTEGAFKQRRLLDGSRWLFIGINAAGLAINLLDTGYFRFSRHRSNQALRYVFSDSLGSFKSLFWSYWLLLVIFMAVVIVLVRTAGFTILAKRRPPPLLPGIKVLYQFLTLVVLLATLGVFPRNLVLPGTPLLSVAPDHLPLAQNSAFTFLYSLLRKQEELKPVSYFPEKEGRTIASTFHTIGKEGDSLQKKNVVICILESFARGYLLPGDPDKAITPFFDSLIRKSIFFPRSIANGFESNQGIVSILGGLPPFLDEPFYYSAYANTPLKSIGNILKAEGYHTNFFMGAGKDHFGFGKFTKMAGIDHYYSRVDFNDDRYYDGNWGIFDEPFLQFGAGVLSKERSPFLAVFFTISSHPPYTIPLQYRERFNFPGKTAPQRSISYVDHSFQEFFAACRTAPWFKNTIFVFCADHWLDPYEGKTPYSPVNAFAIPIFIYDPSRDSGETRETLASQVDLTPTILGLLHYRGSYTGFGSDLLDPSIEDHYALNRIGDVYQVITGDLVLGYDRPKDKTRYLYRYNGTRLLGGDLSGDSTYRLVREKLERWVKANIQCYTEALIRRSLE